MVYVAEQSQQSDDDRIYRDDIVQQPGHDQNKHAGEQRYQGSQTQGDIRDSILCAQKVKLILKISPPFASEYSVRQRTQDRLVRLRT